MISHFNVLRHHCQLYKDYMPYNGYIIMQYYNLAPLLCQQLPDSFPYR